MQIARLPTTNVWSGGAYTAEIAVGGAAVAARVILDTGSSSLVIDPAVYDGAGDVELQATSLAQLITYGAGGWAGPVVKTQVAFGELTAHTPLAIAFVREGNLGPVAGVLGLAYGADNPAWDFGPALAAEGASRTTFPWPFGTPSLDQASAQLKALAKAHRLKTTTVPPSIDTLAAAGQIAPCFALLVRRSAPSARRGADPAAQAADPLNTGVLVLGGGEGEADLVNGDFVEVSLVHELFYNLDLKAVRVDGCDPVAAADLQPQFEPDLASNAILDTGNVQLRLAADVYQAVLEGLGAASPAFADLIQSVGPVAANQLNLAAWPDIHFAFQGPGGQAADIVVTASAYWQIDSPAAGQASFRIAGPLSGANQSNFGLPLLTGRYAVFDRARGVVRVASARP